MILLPKPPKVINKKDNWAQFEIQGLYPGYGITVGNSLRRVLLSSLEGAAITQVKIKSVQHEFSTISGVLEDVITIVMNLKKLRFKMHSDEPQKASLKMKGEKKVKASDFKIPTQLELENKSAHIATLTQHKKLKIKIIPLHPIFTPLKILGYKLHNMRLGERTDFDRLNLEIETDGTIIPEDAFFQALDLLVKHFSLISDPFKPKEKTAIKKEENKKEKKVEKKPEKKPEKKEKK
jgi:DNA-directed RNA polymerase subunit alpha